MGPGPVGRDPGGLRTGGALRSRLRSAAAVGLAVLGSLSSSCERGGQRSGGAILRVHLDGAVVATVDGGDLDRRRALSAFLPEPARDPAGWRVLEARADSGRILRIPDLAEHYPDHEVGLYTAEGGAICVGLFLRGEEPAGGGHPPIVVVGAREVSIRTVEEVSTAAPPPPLRFDIPGAAPALLTTEELEALPKLLPRSPMADQHGMQRQAGWHVGQALGLVASLEDVESVRVVTEGGEHLDLSGDVLRSADYPLPLLKRGRGGRWNLKLWVEGDDRPTTRTRLRNIARIEVRLRPR